MKKCKRAIWIWPLWKKMIVMGTSHLCIQTHKKMKLDKPINWGFTLLELSKIRIYESYNDVLEP